MRMCLKREQKRTRGPWAFGSLLALFCLLGTNPAFAAESSPEAVEFFEKKVRPILVDNCYSCHSASSKSLMGSFRLDSLAGLLKGGDHGAALVPGSPEKSLLVKAISYTDKDLQMPPKSRLSAEQIAALTEWIKKGAVFPDNGVKSAPAAPLKTFDLKSRRDNHWAWKSVRRPALPVVKRKNWAQSPIDNFVLARLEAEHLTPAKPADKRTLLRRVTYDLIGLPPTPAEIRAFLADKSPGAYARVVDRLLASPHYGERWARHWLDLVRYAETDGHEFDFDKPGAFEYRDYVIRAFNSDLPYNQFVKEQIAGDLLPNPRLNSAGRFNESLIGTGFYWLGEGKHSPVDLRDDEAERVDNQIDVMSKTFLGLGLGCARCHDHKFDAISTKDYYALSGYLHSSRYQVANINPPLDTTLRERIAALHGQSQSALRKSLSDAAAKPLELAALEKWKARLQEAAQNPTDSLAPWAALKDETGEGFASKRSELAARFHAQWEKSRKENAALTIFEDFKSPDAYKHWSVTGDAFGEKPTTETAARYTTKNGLRVTGLLPAGIAYSGGSDALQGALRSRTFRIEKQKILYRMAGQEGRIRLIIDGFERIMAPIYGGLSITAGSGTQMVWREMDLSKWVGHRAYVEILDTGSGYIAVDKIAFSDAGAPTEAPNSLVMKMLDDATVSSPALLAERYEAMAREAATKIGDETTSAMPDIAESLALLNGVLPNVPLPQDDAAKITALLDQIRQLEAQIPPARPIMAMVDGTGENDHVHIRGNARTLGPEVPRRFLEACAGLNQPVPAQGSGRLALAERMTSPTNPLLARVLVNRLWQHHFGEGIVRTPDDFGMMGQAPTHPELLDWLASEFVRQKWSIKQMHRLMLLSAAYQMGNVNDARAEAADPQNKLLHKMPVRRLEAECIRDSILALSGRLNGKLYGPSVMPYLTSFMEGRGRPAASGPLDGDGRRSLYLSVRRNFLTPLFMAFDYPVPFSTMGRRTVTNVPAQALSMMNNPFVVQQAQEWAKRILAGKEKTPQGRIETMYLSAFGRSPDAEEKRAALNFVLAQDKEYGAADDIRTWSSLCHVLFNVKEFIFVY